MSSLGGRDRPRLARGGRPLRAARSARGRGCGGGPGGGFSRAGGEGEGGKGKGRRGYHAFLPWVAPLGLTGPTQTASFYRARLATRRYKLEPVVGRTLTEGAPRFPAFLFPTFFFSSCELAWFEINGQDQRSPNRRSVKNSIRCRFSLDLGGFLR